MKNLNRKLSVIALSGMAVFGGVAVSGVQAFAAGNGVAVEQKVKDEGVEKLQDMINKLHFGGIYRVAEASDNKDDLLSQAKKIAEEKGASKFLKRIAIKLNVNNPRKSLNRLLSQKNPAVVVKWNDRYYLIVESIF